MRLYDADDGQHLFDMMCAAGLQKMMSSQVQRDTKMTRLIMIDEEIMKLEDENETGINKEGVLKYSFEISPRVINRFLTFSSYLTLLLIRQLSSLDIFIISHPRAFSRMRLIMRDSDKYTSRDLPRQSSLRCATSSVFVACIIEGHLWRSRSTAEVLLPNTKFVMDAI